MEQRTYNRRDVLRMSAAAGAGAAALASAGDALAEGGGRASSAASWSAVQAETVELTYTNFSSGGDKELWDGMIATFEAANPTIQVTYEPIPGDSWGQYFDKVATLIAGGNPPDVVRVAIEGTLLFVSRALPIAIDDYMAGDPADRRVHGRRQRATPERLHLRRQDLRAALRLEQHGDVVQHQDCSRRRG